MICTNQNFTSYFVAFSYYCNKRQQTTSYHRAPCKKVAVRRQFQFTDCYVPNLNPELYLTEASFVMAHDAATGYLNIKGDSDTTSNTNNNGGGAYSNEYDGVDNMNNNNQQNNNQQSNNNNIVMNTITTKLLSLYGKTQVGTVYEQLNDGARALDLRPKIFNNGTVGFHHGSLIDIPLTSVTLSSLLAHAKQWANDNPTELVLIFHSELVHEAGYNGLSSQVYMETDDSLYYEYDYTDDDDGGDGDEDYANEEGNEGRKLEDQAAQDDQNVNDDDDQQHEQTFAYYYNGIAKIKEIYQEAGVPYRSCDKIAGLTVSQAMDMADLSKHGGKGYLLAVDRHDMYGKLVRVPCGVW